MSARRLSPTAWATISGSVLSFLIVLICVVTGICQPFDDALLAPRLSPTGATAQIGSALALVSHPFLVHAGLAVVAWWCWGRRLRQLATALMVAIGGNIVGLFLLWAIIGRARPATSLDLISAVGPSFPSAHAASAALAAVMVTATVLVTRQTRELAAGWQALAGLGVVLVSVNRWLLGANWVTDILAGLCWGVLVAALALVAARVSVLPSAVPPATPTGRRRRCAVILNPSKVTDEPTFRRHVEFELHARGWGRPIWLETTPDDPGVQMSAVARRKKVDLVIAAGGDGTIRTVCSGLAGSDIPVAVIAAGTGNLLARNLGVPLDERAALDVAFGEQERRIDMVSVIADHDPSTEQHFVVMAGIGIDAAILSKTNPDLKKAVGNAAYFLSAAQNVRHAPVNATFTIDDREPFTRLATAIVIGNVGYLQGGIQLIPDATPDDGEFNLMVFSPENVGDWLSSVAKVLTGRRRGNDPRVDLVSGRRLEIEVDRVEDYELDGDPIGQARHLTVQVLPGALRLRVGR